MLTDGDGTMTESSRTPEETIAEMARRIAEGVAPEKIVLFGSHARGTAGHDSDVDLLVVAEPTGSKRRLAGRIYGLLRGMGLPKDVVVVTPSEAETYRDLPGTIIGPALREGRVLYERAR